jgi:hypothetical protein
MVREPLVGTLNVSGDQPEQMSHGDSFSCSKFILRQILEVASFQCAYQVRDYPDPVRFFFLRASPFPLPLTHSKLCVFEEYQIPADIR